MNENKKYRVRNNTTFDIAVRMVDGKERLIKANSFLPMEKDEIDYLSSLCTLFASNHLTIDDADEAKAILEDNGIVVDDNPVFMDDEEIKKHLRASAVNVKKWLDGVEYDRVLYGRIKRIADEMDLPSSKMKVVEAKLNIEE